MLPICSVSSSSRAGKCGGKLFEPTIIFCLNVASVKQLQVYDACYLLYFLLQIHLIPCITRPQQLIHPHVTLLYHQCLQIAVVLAPQVSKCIDLFSETDGNGEVHMRSAVYVHAICALQQDQHTAELTGGDTLQLWHCAGYL